MKYTFNVTLTDKDYLDFNIFWMIKSPYGKKNILKLRLGFVVLFGLGILAVLLLGEKTTQTYLSAGYLVVLFAIFQIFMSRFFVWSLKGQLKSMKKSGKMAFSPESVMEFCDDYFIEATDENKTQQKYSAIERVSIISGKIIYIHTNNVTAYLLPISCLGSAEECKNFIEFIKTKVSTIDIY